MDLCAAYLTLHSMLDNAERLPNTFTLVNDLREGGYEEKAQEVHDQYVEALRVALEVIKNAQG